MHKFPRDRIISPKKKSISIADIQYTVCLLIFIAKTRINHVWGKEDKKSFFEFLSYFLMEFLYVLNRIAYARA